MSILDMSVVSAWFTNTVNASTADPRWEGDLDGDGVISISDLGISDNFGRNVAAHCKVE